MRCAMMRVVARLCVLLICLSGSTGYSQFSMGESGTSGGKQGDINASLTARAESFDLENTSVLALSRTGDLRSAIESLVEPHRTLVQEQIDKRLSDWKSHRKKLAEANAFETRERILKEGSERQRRAFDTLNGSPSQRSIEEKNAMFVEYARLETESEKAFAEAIDETLPPNLQPEFYKHFTKAGHQFLVSQIGRQYLSISDAQFQDLKKAFSLYTSEISDRLRELRKKKPQGDITLQMMDTDHRLLRLRMALFAILNESQLRSYLRLKGTLSPNGTIDEWVATFPDAEIEIVRPYFSDAWKAK